MVADALRAATERGVRVRIAYNAEHPEHITFPPPPQTKPELLEAMPFPTCGIPGIPDLMHHKYVVRDGESVWTGSMNWTTDSWTLQENVIVIAEGAPELAAEFAQNFEELWSTRNVDATGHQEPRPLEVDGRKVRAWFTPGPRRGALAPDRQGDRASARARADRVAGDHGRRRARHARGGGRRAARGPARRGRPHADGGRRLPVADERALGLEDPDPRVVFANADFKGKPSTQYTPETPHDFMHAKVTVADDVVFAGSFNLSRSGEMNAENVVEVHDAELADRLAPTSTRSASATRLCPCLTVGSRHQEVTHLARVVGERQQLEVARRDVALGEHPLADPVDEPAPVVRSPPARPGTR